MTAQPVTTAIDAELLMREAWPYINRLGAYASILQQYNDIADVDGFVFAGDQMLDEARAFAALLKQMKKSRQK